MENQGEYDRPSQVDFVIEEEIENPLAEKRNTQDLVARQLENRFSLARGSLTLDVHGSHFLSRQSLSNTMNGEIPQIICGELDYTDCHEYLLNDDAEYGTSDPEMLEVGIGGTKEQHEEHKATLEALYPQTTFVTTDGEWNFQMAEGASLERLANDFENRFYEFLMAALGFYALDNVEKLRALFTHGKIDGIKDIKEFFDVKKVSRRKFLKLAVTTAFLGLASGAGRVVTPSFEKEAYLKHYEGLIHLRNLVMVQNFWNVLSKIGDSDPTILFFSGNGHGGCLKWLQEDPSFSENAIKVYSDLFIEKVYEFVEKEKQQGLLEEDAPPFYYAIFARVFNQPTEAGDYQFKISSEESPPSALLIFVKTLVKKMESMESTRKLFYRDVLFAMMFSLEMRPALHDDPHYYSKLVLDQSLVPFSVLYLDSTLDEEINSTSGQLQYLPDYNSAGFVFKGIVEIGGRAYPLQRDIVDNALVIRISENLVIPVK